jgi:hypothetical protein
LEDAVFAAAGLDMATAILAHTATTPTISATMGTAATDEQQVRRLLPFSTRRLPLTGQIYGQSLGR